MSDIAVIEKIKVLRNKLMQEIRKIIIGQEDILDQILITLFSQGHCILVGVPGLAKTLIVNTLAKALSLSFSRIQFTPDLMPADITGTEIIEEDASTGKRRFRFVKGPIFANIILADEINRTPPKTQAALLQAMQEYKVTVGNQTYEISKPFFVLATQNPIEQEGTYPLPEAQLDRFMFEIEINYPSEEEEKNIVETTTSAYTPEIKETITVNEILEIQSLIRRVPVSKEFIDYVVKFIRKTRPTNNSDCPKYIKEWIEWGASPRAAQFITLAAKTKAVLEGRYTPSIEDVKYAAIPVLRHRLILNFHAKAEGITTVDIIKKLTKEL